MSSLDIVLITLMVINFLFAYIVGVRGKYKFLYDVELVNLDRKKKKSYLKEHRNNSTLFGLVSFIIFYINKFLKELNIAVIIVIIIFFVVKFLKIQKKYTGRFI